MHYITVGAGNFILNCLWNRRLWNLPGLTSLELHNQLKRITPPKGRRKPSPPTVAAITAYLSNCSRVKKEYNGKEYRWSLKSNGNGKKK